MKHDPQLDPSTRRILNSNRGVTNIALIENERENITELLQHFVDLLFRHCGPLSQYAMTVNGESAGIAFEPNVFTRDGIDILSSVECMSPLETYIKDLLCYLGSRVDNAAKDGTTTSMLFGALFLQQLLTTPLPDKTLTSFQKKRYAEKVFQGIRAYLDDIRTTWSVASLCNNASEKEIMRVAGLIAFMQAMSSSGGDIELAYVMKQIYERSPQITWDFIEHFQSASENGARFNIDIDEFDSKLRCTSTQEGALNTSLGTEFYAENVRCLIYPDAFASYDIKSSAILAYLKEVDDDHPIVMILTHVPGPLMSAIMAINEQRKNKITVWQYSAEDRLAGQALNWELMIVNAVAGIRPFSDAGVENPDVMTDAHTFIAKSVRWRNTYMEFYGTVESSSDDCLHPFYANPEKATPYYKEVLQELLEQRDMYANNRIKNEKLVAIFTEMLNKITCLHRPHLRLGGPAHEQVANMPVVKDVQGAIMSSLRHGFVINGVLEITYAAYFYMQECLQKGINTAEEKYCIRLLSMITTALFHISEFVYRNTQTALSQDYDEILEAVEQLFRNVNFLSREPEEYINLLQMQDTGTFTPLKMTQYCQLIEDYQKNPLSSQKKEMLQTLMTKYPVIQPIRITEELFRRTQELLMKFSSISEIIVYGGVMLEEKENSR